MEDFKRIINRPSRFLAKSFIDLVEDVQMEKDHETFWSAMRCWETIDGLSVRQVGAVERFVTMIQTCSDHHMNNNLTTTEIVDLISEKTGYMNWFNKENEKDDEVEPDNDKKLNLDAFIKGCERFKKPEDFLLFIDSMNMDDEDDEESDFIHIMTVHKSKGMEFSIVFVLGVSTKIMPHYLADDEEEERRIAYVAATRAKELLEIHTLQGRFGRLKVQPSHFIDEMGLTLPSRVINLRTDELYKIKELIPTIKRFDDKGKLLSEKPIVLFIERKKESKNEKKESTETSDNRRKQPTAQSASRNTTN